MYTIVWLSANHHCQHEFWCCIKQTCQLWRRSVNKISLYEYKGYNARQFIAEFPDKIWTKNCINRLLVKLRNGAMLTGSVTRNFRHFRWCNLGRILDKLNCIGSNSLMIVLCLNVCRLCVPNIMSLGVCFKKLHFIKIDAFAWCSVKIRVIFGVRFERRKVYKKAKVHENWNMQTLF